MRLLTSISLFLSTALLAGPAIAADGGQNLPSAADAKVWQKYVAGVNSQNAVQDWSSAAGTVVADNGFRPYSNGFSFFNYGFPDNNNHALFGTPESGPPNLKPSTLRSMMGEKVCIGGNATGACKLTLAGKLWMNDVNGGMSGGHCFGLAATASQLFNGTLQPVSFQAGADSTYSLLLRDPIANQIARDMATQDTTSMMPYLASPRKIVKQLREGLVPGRSEHVLIMFSGDGGHAVTPYALYDRGAGKFDVAVYDNNYPDFQRVVRIDTAKNVARYAFSVNPDAPAQRPRLKSIGLVPLDVITAQQPCPFCTDARVTRVSLDPIKTNKPIRTRVTKLNGKPIKKLTVNPPTSPWEPGGYWTFPTYQLPKNKSFVVRIRNPQKRAITVSLKAVTGDYQVGANLVSVKGRSTAKVGIDTKDNLILSNAAPVKRAVPNLDFLDNGETRVVRFRATAGGATGRQVGGGMDPAAELVTVLPANQKAGSASAAGTLQYIRNGKAREIDAQIWTELPAGGALVIDYSRWTRNNKRGVRAYVVVDDRKPQRVPVDYSG